MTRKDYERAAEIVQSWADLSENNIATLNATTMHTKYLAPYIRESFVTFFEADNPRFDAERFRAACIPGANVRARPKRAKGEA